VVLGLTVPPSRSLVVRVLWVGAITVLASCALVTIDVVTSTRSVDRPFLALWTLGLASAGGIWWALRSRWLAKDPLAPQRRRLNEAAERVYRYGGMAVYLLLAVVVLPLDVSSPTRWAVGFGVLVAAFAPVHLLAKRRDPRARLWGRPAPLTDEELAQRRSEEGRGASASPAELP
jgi:hypothetical protein